MSISTAALVTNLRPIRTLIDSIATTTFPKAGIVTPIRDSAHFIIRRTTDHVARIHVMARRVIELIRLPRK